MADILALLERLTSSVERESFVVEAIDTLVEACGADRGFVVLIAADGARHVTQARGRGQSLGPGEREELSRTILARAYAGDQVVRWSPLEDASGSESLAELHICAAMAAPLRASGNEALPAHGVVYVDYRDPLSIPGPQEERVLAAIAGLLGLVTARDREIATARQALVAERARDPGARGLPGLGDLLRYPSLEGIHDDILAAAASRAPVLITGASGTGKTLFAESIGAERAQGPVVRAVFAGSDDPGDVALALFGRVEGALPGAPGHTGLAAHANGGTLILDEVLHLPPRAQELLLDLLQFGTYRPLGHDGPAPLRAELRVIATTQGDPERAVKEGQFREDLLYRLTGARISLPPLRARREDIPALSSRLLNELDPHRPPGLSVPLRKLLLSERIDWPGNIRQLGAILRRGWDRARIRDDGHLITIADIRATDLGLHALPDAALRDDLSPGSPGPDEDRLDVRWADLMDAKERGEQAERALLEEALITHGGSISATARTLGLSRTSLASRLNTLGVRKR